MLVVRARKSEESEMKLECLTPEFEGEEVRIGFQFHSEGFRVGDIQKGEFCIICNQLEYSLSFVVSIIRPYGNASTGRIRNLSDFIKLAQTDYMEAYRLFASQGFQHVLKEEKGKEGPEFVCCYGMPALADREH